ncbi:MAG: DUF983 domain-containing protein [Phycisphaerae bacterium]
MSEPLQPSFPLILWRGLRKKCPRCGLGGQFRKWFTLHDRCGCCDLAFEPEPGDTWAFWIVGDRIFLAVAIALIYLGVRPVALAARLLFLLLTIAAIIATMPRRQGICTALDFYFRRWPGDDRSARRTTDE